MNDSEPQKGIFSDLEDMPHKDVELLSKKIEREIRTIEDEHKSLRNERRNQVEIVKSLRQAVGENEAISEERRGLLRKFHQSRKQAEEARKKRDSVNSSIPPPSAILAEWMVETHQRLVTIDNDLTAVPTLHREIDMFKRFFELQAAFTRKQESEKFHEEYVNYIKEIRVITKELDATRKDSPKEKIEESSSDGKIDSSNVNRSDVRKISKRIKKIDSQLDKITEERKSLRKEANRLKTYLRVTSSRGKPIKISEVKDRATSGDSLNTQELGALLRTGGLAELTKSNSKQPKKKQPRKNKGKKQHRKLGVARGGARLGSRVSKRDD
jgi:ABC-type phosphate transport system auxiliary subunit|tara:strand:+ start:675 stop:1652 length:978 start_codon:yes stop_codon:yes gene_type:complete